MKLPREAVGSVCFSGRDSTGIITKSIATGDFCVCVCVEWGRRQAPGLLWICAALLIL